MNLTLSSYHNPSPGSALQDLLEEKGWTAADLAQKTGLSLSHIEALLKGVEPINREIAEKLEEVFEISVDTWLLLNEKYQKGLKVRS